jgi:hypothetical protein
MSMGLTQLLIEMSTSNIYGGGGGAQGLQLYHFHYADCLEIQAALTTWSLSRPVAG